MTAKTVTIYEHHIVDAPLLFNILSKYQKNIGVSLEQSRNLNEHIGIFVITKLVIAVHYSPKFRLWIARCFRIKKQD
ncbi:hypothetical protein KIN20_018321 [Parelaphostrongylus tenuis]|uniref:Uncharacterized protein n=1 Tax=Parelaphostrongylus tenuis TaxID=148309 RepID=A0AAD5N1U4_PARTN|nr:hypothetical protein KIN20_018321 [Parelaphostrongylus tenuis]